MKVPKKPQNELERLKKLYTYEVLDTPEEEEFNEIVDLASEICNMPISVITLLDDERQWFKAKKGLLSDHTDRNISFCGHAILGNGIMEIRDAKADERFHDNPLVTEDPNIRFYAGMPLVTPEGFKLGTLCVIDDKPNKLTQRQQKTLQVLAKQVVKQLELKIKIKELSEVLKESERNNRELKRQKQISSKIISIIAHDLNTPFNTIRSFIELIEKNVLSMEEAREMSTKIKASVEGAQNLLVNLVGWGISSLENARSKKKESINLQELGEEVVTLLKANASLKGNKIVNNLPNLMVKHHLEQLRFILRNLVQNANKYTQQGSITMSARWNNDSYTLLVQDTGIGMHQDQLSKLFDWKEKVSSKGTQGEIGTGIGLPMVKDFADKIGGTIQVYSKLNGGTTFYLTLPV